jgi:hypothetical protein
MNKTFKKMNLPCFDMLLSRVGAILCDLNHPKRTPNPA